MHESSRLRRKETPHASNHLGDTSLQDLCSRWQMCVLCCDKKTYNASSCWHVLGGHYDEKDGDGIYKDHC